MLLLQAELPSLDECLERAETQQRACAGAGEADAAARVADTVSMFLLSTQPERALPVGLAFVQGASRAKHTRTRSCANHIARRCVA